MEYAIDLISEVKANVQQNVWGKNDVLMKITAYYINATIRVFGYQKIIFSCNGDLISPDTFRLDLSNGVEFITYR